MSTLKLLDLFSGIGGFSLGLERVGIEVIGFCEKDLFCQEVLKKNWKNLPIFNDITHLTKEKLYEKEIPKIDIISGGFPCQDLSCAGHGKGISGKRSGLWKEFKRLIKSIQPRYILIENVPTLRSKGLGVVFKDLWQVGYDAQWHCIPASALGAPHRRDRIWILAYPQSNRFSRHNQIDSCKGSFKETIQPKPSRSSSTRTREVMAYYKETKMFIYQFIQKAIRENNFANLWQAEPQPFPLVDGISTKLDMFKWKNTLKAYGNAIIPSIAEIFGAAILLDQHLFHYHTS